MAIYYIDPDDGSDSNDGLSDAAPFATWKKADDLDDGADTMYVKRGTSSTEAHSIAPHAGTTWSAYGTGANPAFVSSSGNGFSVTTDNVTIEGLDISAAGSGISFSGATGGLVSDCDTHDCTLDGCYMDTSGSNVFRAVRSRDNDRDGFSIFGGGTMTCYDCIASGHTNVAEADGFTCHNSASLIMQRCESYDNLDGVDFINTAGDCVINRCYFHGNTNNGIRLRPPSTATSTNTVTNNVIIMTDTSASIGKGGITVEANGAVEGGYNTIVNPNVHASFASGCYVTNTQRDFDMVGDLLLADPASDTALFLLVATPGTTTAFSNHDMNTYTSNKKIYFGGSFYSFSEWQGVGGSPGGAEVSDDFNISDSVTPGELRLRNGYSSVGASTADSVTTEDFQGRTRPSSVYSRGAFEPALSSSVAMGYSSGSKGVRNGIN